MFKTGSEFPRFAEWKSAILQVGNLRYEWRPTVLLECALGGDDYAAPLELELSGCAISINIALLWSWEWDN
jgi:hypothetical protein